MNKIFCLETEWDQSRHDLKMKSAVQPLLEFIENKYNLNVPYIFRQVATKSDFNYYIGHLVDQTYKSYDFVYLCFHGTKSNIHFADKDELNLLEFSSTYPDIFESRNVHFGSCYTMFSEDDILKFKNETKAKMVTGYTKSVSFMESFIFELWLLKKINRHENYRAKRIMDLALEEMPYYVKKLGFVAY